MIGYYHKSKLLQIGEKYPFIYVKLATLEDGNKYMVFEDIYGMRHFLEHDCYKQYEFVEKNEVICTVQKINCTGRFYIEPSHPVYKQGEIFSFTLESVELDEDKKYLILLDCYRNQLKVEAKANFSEPVNGVDYVNAKVTEIRKGIPQLSLEY